MNIIKTSFHPEYLPSGIRKVEMEPCGLLSKITSLLLYAPALSDANSSDVLVPTFYISGALDTTVPPNFVKARYQEATKANAWYGENTNQRHIGFGGNTSVQYYTRAWIYTHLFNDSGTARGCFYGPNWTFKNASGWGEKLKNNDAFNFFLQADVKSFSVEWGSSF